jgi:hypothetical protein
MQDTSGIEPFSVLQELEIIRNDKSERFLVKLEVDQSSFRMAILTLLGQSLGSFTYANGNYTMIVMPGMEKQFSSLSPAALVQLALWPREKAQHGLEPVSIYEIEDGNGWRILKNKKGNTILRMDYEGKTPIYSRLTISSSDGTRVVITTLERD